ncbi:MAG: NADH-quinone oxidoreductase subunit K [Ectothiorhodospiraceae bacterium]|nr:NADH-quinone oxidoreductase subunit K [Ectothiorhodospiraceae bacterium]
MMAGLDVYALAAAALIGLGFFGLIVQMHPLKRLLAVNVLGNGVFLALIVIARRLPGGPDPVPHAMVLTGIVIAVSATAFGLALVRRQARDEEGDDE